MSIIDTLVFDRTAEDLQLLVGLLQKPWDDFSAEEKDFWLGEIAPLRALDGSVSGADGPLYTDEIATTIRGAYNYSDLNRVNGAITYLSAELQAVYDSLRAYAASVGVAWDDSYDVPYDPAEYTYTLPTYLMTDVPTASQLATYLANVADIITALEADYPALPSTMSTLTNDGANAIERCLWLLNDALTTLDMARRATILAVSQSFVFSGQPYSGMIWTQF